ncbi:hypothetical protein ABL840_26705 [Variovorax sp. NFACC27]|jgi:hypothetical protein|uniref:hypothetical protein n=1 Tax=unclassified Variovorax TaxID=663243 RepID=UPI000897EB0C|nr:hypothetical protein SAMN03159371_03708 [Variovorax sp. NFACC28]SEG78204.1 hypothetical protein SAMN03159365_03787 [Variovorax sp. NFACC29]SFC95624.1 hypothetical protein SAMN03159379_03636 [Variovorax sp. NFACC26]SFG08803.1 hypothetical protein SAMN03159447_01744 [Variovorax sp. NFACC27]
MAQYILATPYDSRRIIAGGHGVRPAVRNLPPSGTGYLAGEFPDGITSVQGVPQSAVVRILYRPASAAPGDGVVVAEVVSAADGTWRVDGLNLALKFDVVGRKNGHNDVIVANVSPSI